MAFPNSAFSLIQIVVGTNYAPTEQYTTYPGDGSITPAPKVAQGMNGPIFALHCVVAPSSTVQITTLDGNTTSLAATAFVAGVVYYIYLQTLVASGGGTFIGYQYSALPAAL